MPDPLSQASKRGPGRPRSPFGLLTQAALAREVGVSKQRIGHYVTRGMPVRPYGKVWRQPAVDWIAAHVASEERPAVPPPGRPAASGGAQALGEGTSYGEARRAHEVLKAQRMRLEVGRLQGRLLERDEVVAEVFEMARRYRDSWLNWPARVAALLGARWGVDALRVQADLDAEVRTQLTALAEWTPGARR